MNIINLIKENFKFIDTITTKLLTLVLFITMIPLMVVGNFSSSTINQNMTDNAKSEIKLYSLLSDYQYKQTLEQLRLLTYQASKGFISNAYNDYLKTGDQKNLLNSLLTFKKNSIVDFSILIDANNKLVLKQEGKERQESESILKLIDEALKGKEIKSTESLLGLNYVSNLDKSNLLFKVDSLNDLAMVVAMPLYNEKNQVKAVLLSGKTLANSEIPALVRLMTGATITIYRLSEGSLSLVSTNLNISNQEKNKTIFVNENFINHLKLADNYIIKQQPNCLELGQNKPIMNFMGNTVGVMYAGIPEAKFMDSGIYNIRLISFIAVISLIVAILIAALFARTITTPILKLVIAAKSISSGFLHQRVKIKGNDEIAQLSAAFNRMADNLSKQEQLRDNFVATLTHDLKVPMLAENQTINYLLKEAYGPITKEQKEVLELIKSTNNSSLEMVSTLLEVYRYDSGNVNLIKTNFDMVKLAGESIEQIKSLAQDKKIAITLTSSENSIIVKADEREIKRVLHNLISNAITNGIHRGHIECNIELVRDNNTLYQPKTSSDEYTTLSKPVRIGETVLVSIKDDGIGITREDMQELFKRFSFNKGRKPSGTGLGLYYSYQVITKHRGYIWAESAEGRGSMFKFILPIKD